MNHSYQPRCGCTTRRQLLGWAALASLGALTGLTGLTGCSQADNSAQSLQPQEIDRTTNDGRRDHNGRPERRQAKEQAELKARYEKAREDADGEAVEVVTEHNADLPAVTAPAEPAAARLRASSPALALSSSSAAASAEAR